MVDREQGLGRASADIPQQRANETPLHQHQRGIVDDELRAFLPAGNYEFERIQLSVVGGGVEESGFQSTGERVVAYQVDATGKRTALRGVLTGYQGVFGREGDTERVRIDIVATLVGDEAGTELFAYMPEMDVRKHAQSVAKKNLPISIATNRRTNEVALASRTPAGLIMDMNRLGDVLRFYDRKGQRTLRRARAVAQHLRNNFKIERPPDQPGRVRVKGQ